MMTAEAFQKTVTLELVTCVFPNTARYIGSIEDSLWLSLPGMPSNTFNGGIVNSTKRTIRQEAFGRSPPVRAREGKDDFHLASRWTSSGVRSAYRLLGY